MRAGFNVMSDLFSDAPHGGEEVVPLAEGAVLLRGIVAEDAPALMASLQEVLSVAPFRHMVTPGGYRMSVSMTNCG